MQSCSRRDIARDHDDHCVRLPGLDLAQRVEARAVRQIYVEQHGRRTLRVESRQRRGNRARLNRRVAPTAQRLGERPTDWLLIIYDKNFASG